MKKLDTSAIAPGTAFPVKGGTLLFLQLAYQEAFTALMQANIGASYDPTKGYVLYGCINSGSGANYNISAGAIFFNGEIYLCDGQTFTLTGSNVAEGVITTTQYTADADGVKFTDGEIRNVHNIRKIVFQNGLAGSGAFDFVNSVNLANRPIGAIGQTVEWYMPGAGSQNTLLATYFDPVSLNGIHPLTFGWTIDDGGYFTAAYLAGDANFGNIGVTGGALNHQLALEELPPISFDVPASDNGTLNGSKQRAAWSDNEAVEPGNISVTVSSPNNPFSIIPKFKTKLKITRYY